MRRSGPFYVIQRELVRDRHLRPSDKLVLVTIQDRVGNNDVAWPGLRTIADDCAIAPSTVQECIRRLVTAGRLEVVSGYGQRRSNAYRVIERPCSDPQRSGTDLRRAQKPASTRSDSGDEPDQSNQTQENQTKKPCVSALSSWDSADEVLQTDRLRTEAFRDAWERWTAFRRELGRPLTNSTIRAQLRKLEDLTHEQAIAAIDQSIEHGWCGLFPPGQDSTPKTGRVQAAKGKYDGIGSTAGSK